MSIVEVLLAGSTPWSNITNSTAWIDITTANTTCPGGIEWIEQHFNECVNTGEHLAAFIMGFISLIIWLLPMFPQLYENYKNGNADESLSIFFIVFWFFGDSTNLIGAYLTDQLPTQIYIAFYYILQDCLLLGQYIYYIIKNRYFVRSDYETVDEDQQQNPVPESENYSRTGLSCLLSFILLGSASLSQSALVQQRVAGYFDDPYAPTNFQSRKLQGTFFINTSDEVGYVLGSVSAAFYLACRIPQVIKNIQRGSCEGLSVPMFVLLVVGNLTYGLSVLMAGEGKGYIMRHLPWLIGSLGCCFCDVIVLFQIFYYRALKSRSGDDRESLLETEESEKLLGRNYMGSTEEESED